MKVKPKIMKTIIRAKLTISFRTWTITLISVPIKINEEIIIHLLASLQRRKKEIILM